MTSSHCSRVAEGSLDRRSSFLQLSEKEGVVFDEAMEGDTARARSTSAATLHRKIREALYQLAFKARDLSMRRLFCTRRLGSQSVIGNFGPFGLVFVFFGFLFRTMSDPDHLAGNDVYRGAGTGDFFM